MSMKNKFNATRQKIYEDKSLMSDTELKKIVDNPDEYLSDVVMIAKLILIERGALPSEIIPELQTENAGEGADNAGMGFNVDGPPFERGFRYKSFTLIILIAIASFIFQLIPDEERVLWMAVFAVILGLSVWSAIIAARYLKRINRGPGLAILCFFVPFVGLLIVRYMNYRIELPEVKEIFNKAKEFYEYRVREIKDNPAEEGTTREDMLDELKKMVNSGVNQKIREYLDWLGKDNNSIKSVTERQSKVKRLILDYQHESDPLPILDLTFESNVPGPEEEK